MLARSIFFNVDLQLQKIFWPHPIEIQLANQLETVINSLP